MGTQRRGHLTLFLLLLIGTALRAYQLGSPSLWDDEGFTASILGHDLWQIGTAVPLGNLSLHYYVIALWTAIGGTTEFSLRYVSLWFGVLLIPMTYVLGGKLFGSSARVPAAVLMSFAPPFIYQSQSARPYTLLVALYLANFLFALKLLERSGAKWLWFGFASTAALGSVTHYYGMVLPLLAALLFLPLTRRDPRFLRGIGLTSGATFILLSPWLAWQLAANVGYAQGYLTNAPHVLDPTALRDAKQIWVGMLVQNSYTLDVGLGHLWTLLPLVMLCGGLVLLRQRLRSTAYLAVLLYLFVPVVGGLALASFFTVFHARYLLYVAPLCFVLIAGLSTLPRRVLRLAALAMIGGMLLLWLPVTMEYFQKPVDEDLRILARHISSQTRAGDAIVVNSYWRNTLLDYYTRESSDIRRYLVPLEETPDQEMVRSRLQDVMAKHDRVWLVFFGAPQGSATHAISPLLSERYARVVDRWYGTTRLGLYVKGSPLPVSGQSTIFGNGLRLKIGALQWPVDGKPLDTVVVSLDWQPVQWPRRNYAASMRLIDNRGVVWGQSDGAPRNGYLPTTGMVDVGSWLEHRGLQVPAGTPPGIYSVTLAIYDVSNRQPLPPTSRVRLGPGRELVLGQIRVEKDTRRRDPELLAMTSRKQFVFDGELALLGGQWAGRQKAGNPMDLLLYWQAIKPMTMDRYVLLKLMDSSGRARGVAVATVSAAVPASLWQVGEVLAGRYRLPIDPRAGQGTYTLQASVIDEQTRSPLATSEGRTVVLGNVEIQGRDRLSDLPPVRRLMNTAFGPRLLLVGYTILGGSGEAILPQPTVRAGRAVKVILHWRLQSPVGLAEAGIDRSYTAFVHLLDGEGRLVAQHDGIPGDGQLPTTAWLNNEVIADPHLVTLPTATPPGRYTVIAGLYDSETIERLATNGGADHVTLGEITVDEH